MNIEKLFEKELRAYFTSHRGISADKLDDVTQKLYEKWSDTPCAELGGKTPRQYVESIDDVKTLVSLALESVRGGGEPAPLYVERISRMPHASNELKEILLSSEKESVRIVASELLDRIGDTPVSDYVEIVFDPDTPTDLRETLISRLEGEDGLAEILIPRISETEGGAKFILAELLARSGEVDERIYELLIGLLDEKGAVAYVSQLLSAYGDPRAIEKLSMIAETCDYADYIDIRNAVEELGGELALRLSWDNDASYKKIKGE